jgi:hypothetical protein
LPGLEVLLGPATHGAVGGTTPTPANASPGGPGPVSRRMFIGPT